MTGSAHFPSQLAVQYFATAGLTPHPKNPRAHSPDQIARLASIIAGVGWTAPIIVDENHVVLAGHARLAAAQLLELREVPCIRIEGLSEAKKLAILIGDNKMTDESRWDQGQLRDTLIELTGLDFDIELSGFQIGEIDFTIDGAAGPNANDPADNIPPAEPSMVVTQPGDLWRLGQHRLLCGSALDIASYDQLLGNDRAQAAFVDGPYNVPIQGHVSGLGKAKHREFAMASGEMTNDEYRVFLRRVFELAAQFSADGAIHHQCIDWRHVGVMLEAGTGPYSELLNLCVWNKSNAGMGSLYRSKHELVLVFKVGSGRHINNVNLGKHGRYRSNVWDYPGVNSFGATRDADLAAHPTVKPTALVADAIRDCTKRGGLVLDNFCGSGTTILAAERAGRRAAGIEIDPTYVDVAIRRWQKLTGLEATRAVDGRAFRELENEARSACPASSHGETAQ